MTAPFSKIVNSKHDNLVLNEKQDQAIRLVNSRRKETPAKKASWLPELVLALVLLAAVVVAFYVTTAEHRGAPTINGAPVSEMSISEQLKVMKEVRYND